MALFNRRPKADDTAVPADAETDVPGEPVDAAGTAAVAEGAAAPAVEPSTGVPAVEPAAGVPAESVDAAIAPDAEPAASIVDEAVPHVGISISTFGKPAPARPTITKPPAEAPPAEVVGGMPDNTVLRAALQALPEKPDNTDVMNVMRQALQGQLYLRVRGDARALVAAGKQVTLAVSEIEGNRFLLAFTGGAAMRDSVQADRDPATSAIGQPVANVFQNVLAGPYAGVILDHATASARIILPTELVRKAIDEADPAFTIKNLLCGPRSETTPNEVAEALTRVKLWIAAGKAEDSGAIGVAEARSTSGERRLEVFSHPLEVIALGRGDRPVPITGAQLATALMVDEGLDGVVVDPAGPWIQLDRAQLGAVLALAAA